jgi:hypothetical protein
MIDADERQPPALRDALRDREADEQRADEAGAARDRDAVDVVQPTSARARAESITGSRLRT